MERPFIVDDENDFEQNSFDEHGEPSDTSYWDGEDEGYIYESIEDEIDEDLEDLLGFENDALGG